MPRKKYIYIHLINNNKVNENEFFIRLSYHYNEVIIVDKKNPILNITYLNKEKAKRAYNRLKKTGYMQIFWNENYNVTYQIKKIPIK